MTNESDPRALSYGFTPANLVFDEMVLDRAPDLNLMELLAEYSQYDDDGPREQRIFDHALALFANLVNDSALSDITRNDLFGACLFQATIWEDG